ncbi:MAG TPA: TolC family protein [Gemmatimonadota bacterium]|nr:TolC family protein [Gemmatimonadota bacterium]
MNITSRFATCITAAMLLSTAAPAVAQEPRRITLDEAIELFARNNLELRLARADAIEAAALARQSAAYPNPTITGTHEPLSDGARSYSESYLNLSQRLEWPGTRSGRQDAAGRAAAAARARLAADSARIAFEVKRAYTDAVRAEAAEGVIIRVTEVFRQGERSAEERYAEGDISLYDRRRMRVERARYETRLAEVGLEAAAARRRLALLVAPTAEALQLAPAESLVGLPPVILPERALEVALGRRGEVAAAGAALESARAAAAVARGERIPDLTATGGYKSQSDGLAGAFFGLSLPLPVWDRRGGAVEAAEARVSAAEARLALTRRQVENDVRRALETYQALSRRAELLAAAPSDEAADLLEIARVAYAEGEMELIELLDAAEALMEAEVAEARLRAGLWTGYYDVERAVGGFDGATNERGDR